jgi:metal-responsive CopG/Arc/MetJ family transcriptional regulator
VKRPSGGQPRTGKPARNRLVVLLDDDEWSQLDAYVAKHGRDRSHWVRKALQKLGALKGASK